MAWHVCLWVFGCTHPEQTHASGHTPPKQTSTWADIPLGRHSPSWADTTPRQTTHPGQTPPRQTPPPGRHPLTRHTPQPDTHLDRHSPAPQDGHCSGRYASYWNAFLFGLFFSWKLFEKKRNSTRGRIPALLPSIRQCWMGYLMIHSCLSKRKTSNGLLSTLLLKQINNPLPQKVGRRNSIPWTRNRCHLFGFSLFLFC